MSFLHVIVGAGIPRYFINAVESVLELTDHEILGLYNYRSLTELDSFEDLSNNSRVRLVFDRNTPLTSSKTGSLYASYNRALDHAVDNYDFLHLMQADMQLMHWDKEVEKKCFEIFQKSRLPGMTPAIAIRPYFDSRSRWTTARHQSVVKFDPTLSTHVLKNHSMTDCAIFDAKEITRCNLRFEGTERDMQHKLSQLGYEMPTLPTPVVAFVPWPVTVRGNKLVGKAQLKRYPKGPLLKLKAGYPKDLSTFPWMEDWVFPRGWTALFPYWLSDIQGVKWFRRRRDFMAENGSRFWASVDESALVLPGGLARKFVTPSRSRVIALVAVALTSDWIKRKYRGVLRRAEAYLQKIGSQPE